MAKLTPYSKELISSLDQDVRIIGLFDKPNDLSQSIHQFFVPLLEDYEKNSGGKITVEYIDPSLRPGIYLEIDPSGNETFLPGTYVIVVGASYRIINPDDCIVMRNSYLPLYNNVEPMFTGTIVQMAQSKELRKIYFLSGHREASHTMLDTVLSFSGFATEELDLYLKESVPEDCQLIFVNAPLEDISAKEAQILIDYLRGGGKIIFSFDYSTSSAKFDNINLLMAEMNVKFTNSIVAEYNSNYLFNVSERFIFKSSIVREFTDIKSDNLVVGYSRGLEILDSLDTSSTVTAVITSSPNSRLIEGEVQSEEGARNIALYITKPTSNGEAKLFVMGTAYFTSDNYLSEAGINDINSLFIKKVTQFLYGEEQTDLVGSKPFPNYQLNPMPTIREQSYWSVMLMSIIPLAFLLSGMIVYLKRKNK